MAPSILTENAKICDRNGSRKRRILSASQRERKRTQDREAKQAMRNRTKQHIQRLEKEIAEQKAERQTIEDLQRRNKALEDELIHIKEIKSLHLPPDIALPASILGIMPDSAALTPHKGLQTYNFNDDGSQYTPPSANWEELGVCTGQGTAVTYSFYTHGHGTYCNSTSIENPSLFFNNPDPRDIGTVADSHHGGIDVRLQDIRPGL